MSTARFHLVLTTALAAGLGALSVVALQSPAAVAYPSTGVVSLGSNPVVSGGTSLAIPMDGDAFSTGFITAPAGQDLVVTDLILQPGTDAMTCMEQWDAQVKLGTDTLAQVRLVTPFYYTQGHVTNTHHGEKIALESGIRIPAGQSADLNVLSLYRGGAYCYTSRNASVAVTWSGFLSQP